ncbi:MAG: hypothetical protein HYX27_06390 [Acidobacteria bacterium]|nr:hypothetical protein [Acidobacteriota bacterium]
MACALNGSENDVQTNLASFYCARPIRVLPARNSVNRDPTHNGGFGEEVLIGSEY